MLCRARIINALTGLRAVVPGLNKRNSNVTVCELTIEYAQHLYQALVAMYGPVRAPAVPVARCVPRSSPLITCKT